jgi:hypothetical protein
MGKFHKSIIKTQFADFPANVLYHLLRTLPASASALRRNARHARDSMEIFERGGTYTVPAQTSRSGVAFAPSIEESSSP